MINISRVVIWFEKNSFVIIVLFCIGFFSPNLIPKLAMMDNDALNFAESISGSNLKKQLFWIFFFFFFVWRSFSQKIYTSINWNMLCILLFMSGGVALISALWSEYPLLTIKRSFFQLLFCFTVVSSVIFAHKHDNIEKSLFFGGTSVFVLICFTILTGVGFSGNSALAGFTKGKNLLGQNLLVLISLLLIQIKLFTQRLPYTQWLIIALSVFLLLTTSKTSIALLFIFIFIGHTSISFSRLVNNMTFFVLIVLFIFIPSISFFLGDYIHAGLYLDPSAITGRGVIWDTLYFDLSFFKKLLLGYGYGVFFSNGTIPYFFDDDWSFLKHIASAHSGYIDILIQYGVLFSSIVILCVYKMSSDVKNCWLSAAFIIPIIYNFTESTFLRDQSMMWLFTIILFTYVAIIKEQRFVKEFKEFDNGK